MIAPAAPRAINAGRGRRRGRLVKSGGVAATEAAAGACPSNHHSPIPVIIPGRIGIAKISSGWFKERPASNMEQYPAALMATHQWALGRIRLR